MDRQTARQTDPTDLQTSSQIDRQKDTQTNKPVGRKKFCKCFFTTIQAHASYMQALKNSQINEHADHTYEHHSKYIMRLSRYENQAPRESILPCHRFFTAFAFAFALPDKPALFCFFTPCLASSSMLTSSRRASRSAPNALFSISSLLNSSDIEVI